MEEWKDVKGYEGRYSVSNKGRVKSLKHKPHLILKYKLSTTYPMVSLYKNGVQKLLQVNRLVAEAFLPHTSSEKNVVYKDGNRLNNEVSNLEWRKPSETHNGRKVRCIETGEVFNTVTQAAKSVGGCSSRICLAASGRKKTVYGKHWEYVN